MITEVIDVLDRTAEVCRTVDLPADPFARADLLAAATRLDHTLHELIAELTRLEFTAPRSKNDPKPVPTPKPSPAPQPKPPPPKGCDCAQCISTRRQP